MSDNTTDASTENAGASAQPVSPTTRRRGRRTMGYDTSTAVPRLQKAATLPVADGAGSEDPSDVEDLVADDYATAAESLAQEATQAQDDTADDEAEDADAPGGEFVDAFRPPAATPDNAEPEISGRDQRYREQLREAEADRDRLHGLVESMQRAEIGRLVATRLADPADLFHGGAELADLLDDAGGIDPARVDRAVNEVLAQHPHWASPRRAYRGELRSGATERAIEPKSNRWADAFAPSTSEST
jgi:hypothetical protein